MLAIIKQCRDPLMWYSGKVNTIVDIEREDDLNYWAREDAGYINILKKDDVELISEKSKSVNVENINGDLKVNCYICGVLVETAVVANEYEKTNFVNKWLSEDICYNKYKSNRGGFKRGSRL